MLLNILFRLLLLYLLFISNSVFAQDFQNISPISITGKVINAKTFEKIPHATIVIKRLKKGAICDSLGYFKLQVLPKDTLQIKALGYETRNFTIASEIEMGTYFQIKMHKTSYLLDDVDVYALGTWNEFKDEFLKTKIVEKNPINESIFEALAPYNRKTPNPVPCTYRPKIEKFTLLTIIGRPTDFLYCKLSKSERRKKKISKLFRNHKKNNKIAQLYNKNIVAQATQLQADSLEKFLIYCNPKMEINEYSSEYEVNKQILTFFSEWKLKK